MYREKNAGDRMQIGKNLFVWGFVLVLMAAIATGDVGQSPIEAGADEGIDVMDTDVKGDEGMLQTEEDVSIDKTIQSITFKKDMRIKDALRFLAAKYRKNIVPSVAVDGITPVTSLYDVTFEEALDAILGHSFKCDQEGNFIKVYTADEYKKIKEDKSRMIYKLFTLYYIRAEEAMKLVKPVLSGAGGSGIQGSSAAEDGISTGKEGVSTAAGGDSMALNDTVVIYDYPENIASAEELITAIDVKPKQVLVEATILSATLTENNQLGIDLNLLGGVSLTGVSSTSDLVSGGTISRGSGATTPIAQVAGGIAGTALETSGFASVGGNGLRIGVRSGNVAAFITALEAVTDITILANPKILALNKQVGTVFIGQKIGYRDRTTISDTGQATIGEVKFLDTGTKLSFRPYIGNDGYIRMDIYPKDSSGELDEQGIPTETTAELITNIMVKDGQTIIIGGLFRDAITTTRSQIPLLGDLPLVGAAFRGTTDTSKRQEIIVMLTPHIVSEPADTNAEARKADIRRKRYGARMGLQGISRTRLAEDHYTNAVRYYTDGNNVEALYELDNALDLRPTYLEALRLKEKIVRKMSPDEVGHIERIMLGVIEREEAPKWRRY